MPIGLTAKIEPKGSFVGMVDANQVVGMSGGATTSYLPSSTISSNFIQEYQLKISNSPSDTYYLQYKDSTDKLTWTEVVGGSDVAWSGASEFYVVSSMVKVLDTWYDASSSKISDFIASGDEYSAAYASAQIASYDAGGISAWYDLSAGTGVTPFGGSVSISGTQSETVSILGYATISSNAQKGQASGALALYSETYSSEGDLTTLLNDNYYPSSLGKGISGAVLANTLHSANSSLHSFNVANYITSTNSISRFADSSALSTWKASVTQTEMDYLHGVTSDIQDQIDSKDSLGSVSWTTPTAGAGISLDGTTGMASGALTIKVDDDSVTEAMLKSGSVYRSAALSAQRVDSIFTSTEKTKLGTMEDSADVTDTENVNMSLGGQLISSNAKSAYDWFAASAQALSDYQASGDEWSTAYDWYTASAQKLSDNNSGWSSVPGDNPISHGVSAIPSNILVTPSGSITFGYAVNTVTATEFSVDITAPGNRMISWRAEV